MKNKTTLYHFILDSSGSMCGDREKTIRLFNEQVSMIRNVSLQNPEKKLLTSLTVFNENVKHIMYDKPVHKLVDLSSNSYRPEGFTALYDAIGDSISRAEEQYSEKVHADEMTVVFIVLTDGHENASRRYDAQQISNKIKELEKTEKWLFTILGADFDITDVSSQLSFGNSANYSKTNFSAMSMDMSSSIASYEDRKSRGERILGFFQSNESQN